MNCRISGRQAGPRADQNNFLMQNVEGACMVHAYTRQTQLDHLQVGGTGLLTVTVDDGDGGGDEGADERVSASGRGGGLPAVAGKQRRLELVMALLLLVHYNYYISKELERS